MKNKINIENTQDERKLFRGYKSFLRSAADLVISKENMPPCSVDITLVSAGEIKRLNGEFRGKDAETDVLSFPVLESTSDISDADMENGRVLLGDVIICPDHIFYQAKDFDNSYQNEMALMCIHSVLHLLGYDHIKKKDRDIMFPKQENYYAEFMKIHSMEKENNGK